MKLSVNSFIYILYETLFVIIFIFFNLKVEAQEIDTVSVLYKDSCAGASSSSVLRYAITNNSNEELLTWVSAYPVDNLTDEQKIRCYFMTHYGGVHLFFLLYENLITDYSLAYLGKNFIKNIKPNQSFTYYVKYYKDYSSQWSDRIVILKKKKVESYIKYIFDDKWFYDRDEVTVNPRLIFFDKRRTFLFR